MRRIIWKDDSGVYRSSLLRDTDSDDHPEIGVPLNPPPIKRVIQDLAMDVQNELVRMGVLTYRDLQLQPNAVSQVLELIIRRRLVEEYKIEESKQNGTIQ